ncbi:DsbA family protein [Streptomyces sp. KM273126]|uniref:DsbA family protein n=1 Tax=Streptomyces sp. KM273126 TaxID=2545247 RepID=UPI00103AFB34|nr:DsbA family protein [Streptomyces sp. KM273126]MBA2811355.1 DsbA family protein [Streptomyces sp. KM273126]
MTDRIRRTDRIRLTYAFDAYCGWCYGLGPALRQFADDNADRIDIDLRVLSGGLFSGPRALPVAAYPHIPAANQRIAAATGVTFGDGYQHALAKGTMVMDSTDAATGLVALRRQAPGRILELASALQRAWYIDGHSLSDLDVYRSIAAGHGLDASAVAEAFLDLATRTEAEGDFRELRQLGVDAYPTLLLHTPTGTHRLGGPLSSALQLTEALDRHMAPTSA